MDYPKLDERGDKLVSVGMFEHVETTNNTAFSVSRPRHSMTRGYSCFIPPAIDVPIRRAIRGSSDASFRVT